MAWWVKSRRRFSVPLHIECVTHREILLRLDFHDERLLASICENDLSVVCEIDGTCWDMLLSLDAYPVSTMGGFYCSMCEPTEKIWPTREALWTDHLFEPFLGWVNERLAVASRIERGSTAGGSTWAELITTHLATV